MLDLRPRRRPADASVGKREMEKKILITVDGSATTMATLAYVAMMAAAAIADLSVVLGHVSDRVARKGAELAVWVVGCAAAPPLDRPGRPA